MSVATVYNNLRVFREAGLVKELTYGDASSRFDFVTSDHYHAICENCGKIVDFHYPGLDEVEQLAAHVTGFKVSHHRLEIYGVCQECSKKRKPLNEADRFDTVLDQLLDLFSVQEKMLHQKLDEMKSGAAFFSGRICKVYQRAERIP